MKKIIKLLKAIAIIALLLGSNQLVAQTNTSPAQNICAGSLAEPYLISPPTSGSSYQWILTAGGTLINGTTSDNITVDWGVNPGIDTITVTETDANGCLGAPVIVVVTVIPLDDATFTLTDFCEGSANSATVTGTPGGVFTFTTPPALGEAINGLTGEITGGISGNTYSVTYTTSGICPQASVMLVTIIPLDDATFALTDFCEGSANSAAVTGTLGGVFAFTTPPAFGEAINGLTGEITGGIVGVTYSVTYTTSTGTCSQTSVQTVTVNPLDDATFTLTDYCEGSANSATVTGTLGGVFTFTIPPSAGEAINGLTGEITGGISGTTYSITYTTPGSDCPQSSTMSLTIYITPSTSPISHW